MTLDTANAAAGQGNTDTGAAAATDTPAAASEGTAQGQASAANAAQGAGSQPAGDGANAGANADAGAAGNNAAQAAGDAGHWSTDMPEAWRAHLAGFDNPEAALAALKRGAGYTPPTKPEDVKLSFPDGFNADMEQAGRFQKLCCEAGITGPQAQQLLEWQMKEVAEANAAMKQQGEKDLRAKWGNSYEANAKQALNGLTLLDRRMDGRLAPALAGIGAADSPVVIEALHIISTLVSEDSLSGGRQASGETKPMSYEEFLSKEIFKK